MLVLLAILLICNSIAPLTAAQKSNKLFDQKVRKLVALFENDSDDSARLSAAFQLHRIYENRDS